MQEVRGQTRCGRNERRSGRKFSNEIRHRDVSVSSSIRFLNENKRNIRCENKTLFCGVKIRTVEKFDSRSVENPEGELGVEVVELVE